MELIAEPGDAVWEDVESAIRDSFAVMIGSIRSSTQLAVHLVCDLSSMCFALSKTDAGSDLWGMRTTAVRDGSGWRIDGSKQWMTNGLYAD